MVTFAVAAMASVLLHHCVCIYYCRAWLETSRLKNIPQNPVPPIKPNKVDDHAQARHAQARLKDPPRERRERRERKPGKGKGRKRGPGLKDKKGMSHKRFNKKR